MTIYINHAAGKGLGVFAGKSFKIGEVIEECPVIILSKEDSDRVDTTALWHYRFVWGDDETEGAICLGYGSIYNHSHTPNAEFDPKYAERKIVFNALQDIAEGEEICIDYNWELDDSKAPDWFKLSHPEWKNQSNKKTM